MNTYGALLAESGLPAWLHDASQGAFSFQADIGYDAPAAWYTCPPALIPLASDSSMPDHLGIWTRWFSKDPHLHVVITGPEDRFLLREIALTAEQFAAWIVAKAARDPGITKQMTAWCSFSEDAFIPESDAY